LVSGLLACPASEAPVAHIRTVAGDVTWKTTEDGNARAAAAGVGLTDGNIVTTGGDGYATVEFRGGNEVNLQPDTTFVIRKSGGSAAQFGAVLLAGSAHASSAGHGVLLAIGTPFGLTELGATESSLEMNAERGIAVMVGEVTLLTSEGRTTLVAGTTFTVDGIQVEVRTECHSDEDCADGEFCNTAARTCEKVLVLPPMEFVLLANPRQVQVKRAGTTQWQAPDKREGLAPGDAVRTRRAGDTQVQFGDLAGLTMSRNTEIRFDEAGTAGNAHRAQYDLLAGSVSVRLAQDEKTGAKHGINVAGMNVTVVPGLQEAAVDVAALGKGRASVKVRLGRVLLSDGTTVNAGSAVTLQNGAVAAGGPRPIAFTRLALRPRSSSIVYFSSDVPPIQFAWPEQEGVDSYELEVASNREFDKTVFRERVPGNSFVFDRFGAGRYYWRVKGKGDWLKGVLSIQRRKNDQAQIKRTNDVIDSGEKTVIYYQKALPALKFKWSAVVGAARYRLKVYPDRQFDTPLVNVILKATSQTFPEGKFPEGKYYWHQVALDAAGKSLRQGRMNTLTIAYDNAIIDLAIKSPRPWQKVSGRSLVTVGEVQLGASLAINGRQAKPDSKGRFREMIRLEKGVNQIVYRTLLPDGIERYYVRHVFRR
jgi:hypothetical protein